MVLATKYRHGQRLSDGGLWRKLGLLSFAKRCLIASTDYQFEVSDL
ncbi:Uncharacterised protein [Yersinia intermedia]|nr:Uncharacterised protein [Yersinia intermedia]CNI15479.1 Uncharacterised protein [Yersinia intermedia]CRE36456.1 Uncharacterised protein [Yersinia intermedia]